ncbi:cell filamentation protein Fic [Thalassospira marina]|uniref:Cell filamentation protein Fic n=2 Tax=Thalassospira marina TaxID=2048283 RepID=A0ABN5FKF1_9PROT|nr:cell filamentation protein Fic [Thalassospira marina]
MEPMLVSESARRREDLIDLAMELTAESAAFKSSLPQNIVSSLANLVRSMNCYYSNLIEGHNTHPVDIERALQDDYSTDARKRDLQLEAKAHITVQKWIDDGGLSGRTSSAEGLIETHKRFCELLPADLLSTTDPQTGETVSVVPGAFRDRDVQVGRHIPVSSGAIPRFLERFSSAYSHLNRTNRVLASAAAHHRLLWIHPFLDGNGRVTRLMTHAMLLENLDTGAIWSVARGLARQEAEYKRHLANCDKIRQGDLDGRGHLSQNALINFTEFFLQTAIDQVKFMRALVEPNRLRERILSWARAEIAANALPTKSDIILDAILYRGELPRSDIPGLLDVVERQARRVTSVLQQQNVLTSESPKAPFRLAFPATLAGKWMPGLFPEQPQ